jgi:hypothetical protein
VRPLRSDPRAGEVGEREVLVEHRRVAGGAVDPRLPRVEPGVGRRVGGRQWARRRVHDVPLDHAALLGARGGADPVGDARHAVDEVGSRREPAGGEVREHVLRLRAAAGDEAADADR